jgi:hypothetical protein
VIVPPVLLVRLMPRPLSVIEPVKATVPPVWLVTSIERPELLVVIVPLSLKLPVPLLMSTPRVVAPTIEPPETVTLLVPRVSSRMPFPAPLVVTLEKT